MANQIDGYMEKYLWKYVDKLDGQIENLSEKIIDQVDKYVIGETHG